MSGILRNDGVFPLSVGGWKDHVHVFFELPPSIRGSDLIRDLKVISSKWNTDNGCMSILTKSMLLRS